jgi:nitrogen PTS system EIIA component
MKLTDFIVNEAVSAQLVATDRDKVIEELVNQLAQSGALEQDAVAEVVAALLKRERNASTGFGKGVAVPHCKHAKVKKLVGTVGLSAKGVDFSALDKQPVFIVFVVLSPEGQTQTHLSAMDLIFRNLTNDRFRKFLRQCTTPKAIVDLLQETDSNNA